MSLTVSVYRISLSHYAEYRNMHSLVTADWRELCKSTSVEISFIRSSGRMSALDIFGGFLKTCLKSCLKSFPDVTLTSRCRSNRELWRFYFLHSTFTFPQLCYMNVSSALLPLHLCTYPCPLLQIFTTAPTPLNEYHPSMCFLGSSPYHGYVYWYISMHTDHFNTGDCARIVLYEVCTNVHNLCIHNEQN